ncbi:MAG: DUF2378 family protein [Deltaproteobacteria bacterium]|nr:DUF2378 family protein [Deltaproteobacteria bacterium]
MDPSTGGLRFPSPDWQAPLDLDAQVAAVPPSHTVRGMSINGVLDAMAAMGRPLRDQPRRVAFKDHPQAEMVAVLVQAARALPDLPPREALRRVGQAHLEKLQENMVMRVMFAGLGQSLGVQAAAALLPRAYRAASSHEQVEVLANEPRRLMLRYRDCYSFADCFQVGVLEGGLRNFKVTPRLGVRVVSRAETELELAW